VTDPLLVPPEDLARGTRIGFRVVADRDALSADFAEQMLSEVQAARAAGRARVVFIVPVGPVGQYDILARLCAERGVSLADLTLIGMDEYVLPSGERIAESHPLSFRRHMREHMTELMDPATAPEVTFPDPADLPAIPELIARLGGVDVCFAGVGICGHLAFNEPPEPGEACTEEEFASRPTRVLRLARETRTINAVTATRGAIDLIPERAVTVGMKEILGARKLRLFLNRPWQTAILRKLLHGPVTPAVPASFAQRHPDCAIVATEEATRMPAPALA
jgi:glucosamine-6-phosphate deaminase